MGVGFSDSGDRPLRAGLPELKVLDVCIGICIERLMWLKVRFEAAARSREELVRGAVW